MRVVIAALAFFLSGCVEPSNKNNFVNELMANYPSRLSQEIVFPKWESTFSIKELSQDYLKSGNKIVFVGYANCSPCVIRLKEIERYIKNNSSISLNTKIFYIAHGMPSDYFKYQVKANNFSFPVFYDPKALFMKQNGLESFDKAVFLLDSSNRVILIGSPFENKVLQKHYEETLTN